MPALHKYTSEKYNFRINQTSWELNKRNQSFKQIVCNEIFCKAFKPVYDKGPQKLLTSRVQQPKAAKTPANSHRIYSNVEKVYRKPSYIAIYLSPLVYEVMWVFLWPLILTSHFLQPPWLGRCFDSKDLVHAGLFWLGHVSSSLWLNVWKSESDLPTY